MTEGGALQTVFDKAYFGKIFHVKVPREKKKQKEMHIITSWFYLDIYSDNFGRRLHHIAVRSIDSVGVKNDVITIHVKEKEPLKFECDNMEELKAAITPVDFKREVTQVFRAHDIFAAMGISGDTLNKKLFAAAKQFYELVYNGSIEDKNLPAAMSDILACLFKLKHSANPDPDKTIEELVKGLKLHFLLVWIEAVNTAASLGDVDEEYIRRVIVYLSETIIFLGDSLQIQTKQFASAVAFYYEQKNKLGIVHESKKMQTAAKEMLSPDSESATLRRLYETAVVMFAARLSGCYLYNTDTLRDLAVKLVLEKDEAKYAQAIDQTISVTIGDMLRRLNDKRYESAFQFVFALWKMRDAKKTA